MGKGGKEQNPGLCSRRRFLFACILTPLVLWPCFLMLYLDGIGDVAEADQEFFTQASVRPRPRRRAPKPKESKPRAEPKKIRGTSADLTAPESGGRTAAPPSASKGRNADRDSTPALSPQPASKPTLPMVRDSTLLPTKPTGLADAATRGADQSLFSQIRSGRSDVAETIKPCPMTIAKQRKKRSVTVGLVTRIYRNDLPYVGSFIQHHQNLGVRTFYFALTRKTHGSNVREYLLNLPFLESTAWQLFKNERPDPKNFPRGVLGDMIDWVKEDWVVHLDIDEYVTLGCNAQDFGELVASDPNSVLFRFGRVTVPLDSRNSYIVQPPYRGITDEGSKYLVKCSSVESVPANDYYKVKLKCTGEDDCLDRFLPGTLVHFFARGFGDAVVKAVGANHGNSQDSNWKKVGWLANQGRIPDRLRILAYMSVASVKSQNTRVLLESEGLPIVTVDRIEESRLVKFLNVSGPVLDALAVNYQEYKKNITRDSMWQKIGGQTSLLGIAQAIA